MPEIFFDGRVTLFCGDSREVLKEIPDNSIDSIGTDPPYALVSIQKRFGKPGSAPARGNEAYMRASAGFMGQAWDVGDTAFAADFWAECLRVLKPGGHVAAFSGTRTYHRLACAIEDAGFEIRDMVAWVYGSGFPKSHDVSKAIDKELGAVREKIKTTMGTTGNKYAKGLGDDRPWMAAAAEAGFHEHAGDTPATPESAQWSGWGTALKPAFEPICLARKPISEKTVAANVLRWGTGAINIDGARVEAEDKTAFPVGAESSDGSIKTGLHDKPRGIDPNPSGRFPANLIHDGSEEVVDRFPDSDGQLGAVGGQTSGREVYGEYGPRPNMEPRGDSGSAARFFYSSKADGNDRLGSKHPTVKPVDLMQYVLRLITPPGGTTIDPFSGTGTTGEAAYIEGFNAILIERESTYQEDIRRRMETIPKHSAMRKLEHASRRNKSEDLGIFQFEGDE